MTSMFELSNPRQTILVTSRANVKILGKEVEKDNIFALTWHMPVSFAPEIYAIAVSPKRFSYNLIEKSKVFAVNFMPAELEKAIVFCGRNNGEHIDKFEKTGLTKVECDKIDCPRIKEALAYLECQVIDSIEQGDHVVFFGKVISLAENKKGKRLYQTIGDKFTTTEKI